MAKTPLSGGSTGAENLTRLQSLFTKWRTLTTAEQTSGRWELYYGNRNVYSAPIPVDFIIAGGEANSPVGAWALMKRLHGSTRNTSTRGRFGTLGLPDSIYSSFVVALGAVTTRGTQGSSGRAQNLLDIYNLAGKWQRDQGLELVCWWGGQEVGSSQGVGSSV